MKRTKGPEPDEPTRRGGAPEVLTEELARKICRFIEQMPDSDIPVTWERVVTHVNRKFSTKFKRNVLATKDWGGQKLIRHAYLDAKAVQQRQAKSSSPIYANSSRIRLREEIVKLQAKVHALQEQLEIARKAQVSQLDVFRVTRLDLRKLATDAGLEERQ